MPDSPYDYIRRRQASLADSDDTYATPDQTPPSFSAQVAQNDQQAESDEAAAQAQQAKDAAAQAKAQQAQNNIDQANAAAQARVDAANDKANGVITQDQAIPGPTGKAVVTPVPQQNPDGTTAYQPADLGNQTFGDGSTLRGRRNQWGAQDWSDSYAPGNAALKLDSAGSIIAKPDGKNSAGLPAKDVTTQGVTGLDATDAQGNPDPSQLKVAPNAPINDPTITGDLDQREQKIVKDAAAQRVKDTVASDASDAQDTLTNARQAHSDARADLTDARAERYTAADGKGEDRYQDALKKVGDTQAALSQATTDAANKKDLAKKAGADPLAFLQQQSDDQSQAAAQASGQMPSLADRKTMIDGLNSQFSNDADALTKEAAALDQARQQVDTTSQASVDAFNTRLQAFQSKQADLQQRQKDISGHIDAFNADLQKQQPISGSAQTPDTGAVVPNGVNPAPQPGTPQPAGAVPDSSQQADPHTIAGLITGAYGKPDDPGAPAAQPQPPNDGAPPGQRLVAYKSLISGRTIDPNSFTGGIVEFARRVDNDLDASVLGAVGGTVRLASAFGQSSISPAPIAERTVDGLIGTHTAQDQQDFAKKLGVAADTIDAASRVAALPVSSTNDNSTLGKSAQWTSLGLQSMLGGEGKVAKILQGAGYAVQAGESARQNALAQGATESAADQAGITAGAEMALGNYVFGPFSKLLSKVPGISSASPTLAKAALNTIMGFGLKAAKGATEFGLINAGSEAANQIALEQSGVANPDAGTKIAKAGLDGLAQGAIIQGSMETVERGSLEYNNLKVGQALKAQGGKAAIVVQTAHAFQGIDAAQRAGKLTPQQAQAARAAVVSPFTPANRDVLVNLATSASEAQAASLQVMQNAAKAAGTPVAGFENASNSDVHQAAAKAAGIPAPDADLAHLNDKQLAAEHDEVSRTVQQHQAAQNPEPQTIRMPDGTEIDNPNWTGKTPFDPGVRRMGKPDATPEYQQKVAAEIARRQQSNQAVSDFADGPRPDGDAGDLHDEINRRLNAQQVAVQTKVQLKAISDKLAQQTKATEDLAQTPEGRQTIAAINAHNAKQPVGAPKADALTAQKASDLAPKTAGVDLQPTLEHYLPVAQQIEQLSDPDQQAVATAALKLVNGRALNSSEQTLMLGDGGGTPPAVDALTGRPFVSTSNGKTVLTDAGLERLRTLVPAASDILPKNEQAQLEAQPPPLPNGKGGKVADSGTKNSQKSATPPPLPADDNPVQSQPNPEFGHLDDATLTVQRDNLKAAINKAAEKGGKVPPAARQRLARIEAEIDHRDRIPMGDDGGGGQPPGFERIPTAPKVGDDVAYTFDHADQGTVKTHGEVTEAGPDHYRVVDANDGVERNVPFSRITSHVPPETPDGKAAESAPEAGKPGAVDGQLQGGDGAANGRPHSPEPSASPESGAKTGAQNPRLTSAIEASFGGRRMELTDNLRKQPLSTYTDSSAGKMTVEDGIKQGYLEEVKEDGKTFVRQAKPDEAGVKLPGIDPKTIAPEHREVARLLSKSYARLKPLFDALGLDPDKIFTPVAHGEGTIGLSVDPSDPTHVQIDLARLDKNLARLGTPGKKALRMDAVLEEEAIHIAGEKVLGDKSDATHEAIWKSLTDDQREKVIAEYGEHLRGDGSTDANRGREYIRMLVQLQRSGRTTEWSNRLSGATVDYLHKVVNYLKSILKPGNQAVQDLVDRIQSVLDRGTQGETAKQSAQPADVSLPNGDTVPAKYELAELGDIQPSHRNGTANPDYPAGLNERDYSLPQEKAKNEGMVSSFDPRRVITDNPDAVNGPPIVDKKGIVLGGNRRTIMLSDPRAYAKYKPYLQQNAERFGLNPDDVAKMHQPVLIRRVDVPEDQRPELIRRLNETPTGGIDTANDAVSAGKQITPDLIKSVSDLFQQDPDKTPLQHLSDGDTKTIAQGLLDAGAIRPNDKEKYIAANGNLTPEGARFARSVLLGGVLPDAQLLREISDTPTETKLLNGLSPLYTMKARGADIAPLQEAVALEADRQRLGIKNVNEHQAQGNLAGIGKESTTEGKTIQSFLAGIKGNEARRAFTQLQNLISPLEPGQTGLFGESNRKSIADVSDAEMNKVITSSKKITKAAADLKQAIAGAEVDANEPNEIHQAAHHVRDLAEKEAPKYLQDVRDAGASVGLTMPPGVEVHAVKTAKSLTTKLGLKADEVPTDLLRTTLISKLPLNAIHNQALALIQRMKSKGYTIYAPDGVADVKTGHVESQGYKDIAIKFERPGDPIIRELQILQPAMKEVKDGRGHVLYDDAKDLKTQIKAEKDPKVRAGLEERLAQNKAESDALYDEAYRKDNPDQSASGSGNPSAPRLANIKSPTSLRGAAFLSASNFAKRASTSAGVNGASATSRGLASFRSLGGNAITPTDTPNPGETQHPIAGGAVRDTATPDLFAQPPTPQGVQTKADEAPMTKADALRAYNVLSAIRAGGGTLRADQARNLERAERALGQTFIPGTEETAAPKPAPNPDPVNLQPTRGKRVVHQTLFDTGKDVQAGQNLLFGSAVADEPAVEEPLARYMTALHQGEFSFGKPIDFSREFQTDTGIQPAEPLIARAREMEVQPSEADGAKMSPDQLFNDHLDVADRIAANFDNIPGQQPEDARQVARTALNHAAQTYDPSRGVPFRGYAPRIIRNSLLDSYRSQNRRAAEQTTLDRPIDPSEPEVTAKDQVPANEPTAGEAAARNDAHSQLRDYIQRVSMAPESRRALQGLLDGKDQNEMAKEMGVTPQRVSAMVGVGLEKLRQVFKAKGIDRKAMVAGGEIPEEEELPNQKLVKPEDLVIGHEGDSFGEARDNFDAEDPSTWPFAKASELEDYKTELDSFDEDDPDTWDEFLPKALAGEHANIAELADDTEGIADRLESQDGVNPNLAKKARELADEVRGQADQIKEVATRNADYVRSILDQAKSKAEDYFKDSDDPDVNLARTDIDQPEEWPQAWRDEYTDALKQHGVAEDDYEHPARKEINDAFDAKHKPEIEAAQARVAARKKAPEQGTLFGGEVKEEDKMAAGALGFHDFVHGDIAPRIEDVANVFREAHDGMVQTWAPQLRSGSAAKTARVLSANLAEIARARDQAEDAFHKARNLFATRSPAQNLAFIDAIETNSKIADPQLQDIARNLREMNNQRVQLARSLPGKQFRGFIENYFPHIFKQGEFDAAQKYFQRKIEGSRAFLKHRSIPTVREAVQAGFHLVSDNPVDLFLMRWRQMDKFVAAQRVLEELKGDGTARTFKSEAEVPPGWVKIDPKIGWSTEEVAPSKDQPELDGREAKPTLRYVPVYAPGEAAAVLNNYLSPGLRHSPLFGGVYKAVTGAANVLNSAQLGFSFFHLGFTTYDTMVSKAAQAIEQAVEGKGMDALKSLASLPATPVTNFLQGDKLLKEWYRPGSQGDEIGKLVNAVVQGGGRAQMDPLYASHFLQNTITNWKKGNYLGAAMRAPFAITETVMKPIMEYLVPRQKLGVAADLMRREMDKLGPNASQDDVRQAMQRAWSSVDNRLGQLVYDNLHWNKVAKDAALVAVRSVGWNLGTYRELGGGAVDYAKALANLTRGQRAEFTHRMAYATALPLLTMAAGSLIQYLMTGESPSEAMDYFFPKTGETDVNGKPMRIALPSYMKDVFATAHDPVGTIENKVNPLLSSFLQLWNNKDYYGTQVYNPDDPMTQKATDILGFAGKQLLPFSFTGASKFSSANPPPSNSKGLVPRLLGPSTTHALLDVAPSVGAVPAASWISQSSAERRALELEDRLHAGDVKTKADADAAKKYTALRNTITQNDPAQPGLADDERQRRSQLVAKAIRDGIANQTIKPEAVPNLIKKARMTPLQRMFDGIATEYDRRGDPKTAYEQTKTIWDAATPEERKTLGPDFAKLWGKARSIGATKDPNPLTPKQ